MAEKDIEEIQKLTHNPERIRNIGIVAHIDHGKCVSGDSRIPIGTGSLVEAKDLFERIKSEGQKIEKEQGEVYEIEGLQVPSYNKDTGEVELKNLTKAWKLKKTEDLIEVENELGQKIKTTPEHRFLILKETGDIDFKRADKLEEGDTIVSARKIPFNSIENIKEHFLNELADDYGFIVEVNQDLNQKIRKRSVQEIYNLSDTKLKKDSLAHAIRRAKYRLRDILNISEGLDIDLEELYRSIDSINYREFKQRGVHSSLDLKLPEDLSSVYYLAGLFLGDGSLENNVTNNSSEIKERLKKIAEELGIEARIREFDSRGDRIEIGGKTFRKMLEVLFAYHQQDKSHSIRVSETVFRSNKNLVKSFVRGYLDADGTIEKSCSAVSASSANFAMLEDLQLLLNKFDIASNLDRNKNQIYISGKSSLEKFKEINFGIEQKRERFERLLNKSSTSKADLVPIDGANLRQIRNRLGISQNGMFNGYSNYENNRIGLSRSSLTKILNRFEKYNQGGAGNEIESYRSLLKADTSFNKVKSIKKSKREDYVYDFTVPDNHNFVADGVIVHNTTLTDSLLARAGLISEKLAGQQLFMDYDDQEAERGITIYSANVSMVHELEGKEYLINLIDTPGHVDFGGDVTRAMRAVDGALVLVDAVDGVMPQTETVLRQALKEGVKPILFVNKVDRLIQELKLDPEEMQQRFIKIISEVNKLIKKISSEAAEKWKVKVDDGSVAFGSALYKWAISKPFMEETGISFKDIIEGVNNEEQEELAKKAPLHQVTLDMIVKHLVNPQEAQKYRIPQIWHGEEDSETGKSMINCDEDGDFVCVVTNVENDPHAGTICTARVFSGTAEEGQELHGIGSHSDQRVQQVGIYSGPRKIKVPEVPAGNIIALTGVDYGTGETVVEKGTQIEPFEKIEHIFEPVVTKSIEPKKTSDLPELIEVLRNRAKEDDTIKVEIDEDTGETLVSGLGELHIEAKVERFLRDKGIDIQVSKPIVVYRESVSEESEEMMGVSPNRHNKLFFTIEPMEEEAVEALEDLPEGKVRSQDEEMIRDKLTEAEMDKEEASNVMDIYQGNVFLNMTRGIQYLHEIVELLNEGFHSIVDEGPLANEPCSRLKVKIHDAKLHEDAIHRGPAQIIPAVRDALTRCILSSGPQLLEPKQVIRIDSPSSEMGSAIKEVNNRRGEILSMEEEEDSSIIKAKLPVAEMFGFEASLKSATGGKGFYSLIDQVFEPLPGNLRDETILEIRDRKGMKNELPEMGE